MTLNDIVIVLVRPEEPGNIGAVCRAMKNHGLRNLYLVGAALEVAAPPAERIILQRAVHAADVWEGCRRFETLADAAADSAFVVGTTRRRGAERKSISIESAQIGG